MQLDAELWEREYALVRDHVADDPDPQLRALQVAVYLEDALDIVLPESALDWAELGSLDRVRALVGALRSDR